jgi:hypothetical protein
VPNIVYFEPLNLHLLSLYFSYFLIFLVSFGILVFCRTSRENIGIFVKLQTNRNEVVRAHDNACFPFN